MDFNFLVKARYIGIAFIWIGLLAKTWNLFYFGLFIWVTTYLYSFSLIERSFHAMLEEVKREKANGKTKE